MPDQNQVTFSLVPSPDEPHAGSPDAEHACQAVTQALDEAGIAYTRSTTVGGAVGSPDTLTAHYLMGLVQLARPVVGEAFTAWKAAKAGRTLTMTFGGVEQDVRSPADLQQRVREALGMGVQGGPPTAF
jgi:hypothetical protein